MGGPDSCPRQYPLRIVYITSCCPDETWTQEPMNAASNQERNWMWGLVELVGYGAEGQHLTAQSFEVASLLWKELDQEEGRPVAFPPAAGSLTNVIALRYVKYSRVLVAPAACRPQPMHK